MRAQITSPMFSFEPPEPSKPLANQWSAAAAERSRALGSRYGAHGLPRTMSPISGRSPVRLGDSYLLNKGLSALLVPTGHTDNTIAVSGCPAAIARWAAARDRLDHRVSNWSWSRLVMPRIASRGSRPTAVR